MLEVHYKWFRSAVASGNTDSAVNTFGGGSHAGSKFSGYQYIPGGFVQNLISKFGWVMEREIR